MQQLVIDIETDSLDPTVIWCIVAKEYPSGKVHTYTHDNLEAFRTDWGSGVQPIGHNIVGFDLPVLHRFIDGLDWEQPIDTMVLSKLRFYGQQGGHSLDSWGKRLGDHKSQSPDFSKFSEELVEYCKQDVEVTYKLWEELKPIYERKEFQHAIQLETDTLVFCREMQENGFPFDFTAATKLELRIQEAIEEMDRIIMPVFKPRTKKLRTITPTVTKAGTLHLKDFRWLGPQPDLTQFNGGPFSLFEWREFNPRSPSQIVERMWEYGWNPYEKTKGHFKHERKVNDRRRRRKKVKPEDIEKLREYRHTGWSINEDNLNTLPASAPEAAHTLVRRLLLASRLSTIQSWRATYNHSTAKIHGTFHGMGAWTHRMAHSSPNMANIPRVKSEFGKEMRQLWLASPGKVLVGTDASGIQLRVLAHYLRNDKFTQAVCFGTEEEGTDIHTMNMKALHPWCKDRDTAKTFIYSWLLNAGIAKTASILECNQHEAQQAREQFLHAYEGLSDLREYQMVEDANRGYFVGLDGRLVVVPSLHYVLAGYLQNGEAIIMKEATRIWTRGLRKAGIPFTLRNFVHDEWQTECDERIAGVVGETQVKALEATTSILNLNCPMTGEYKIGHNWAETH
jgi:DNA polymerase-1